MPKRDKLEDVEPQKQYRGTWIPPEIMELFGNGELSAIKVMLLATIDSLVSPERGCFASNAYLAQKINKKEWTVSNIIKDLKHKGLLIEVAYDGRTRYLETVWSRIDPNKAPSGWLREALEKSRNMKTCENPQGSHVGNHKADCGEITSRMGGNKFRETSSQKDGRGGAAASRRTTTAGTSLDGEGLIGNGKAMNDPPEVSMCKKLKDAVHSKTMRVCSWKTSIQSKHFKALIKEMGEGKVSQILEWYISHLHERVALKLPRVTSPAQFREHLDWIMDRMEALAQSNGRSSESITITDEAKKVHEYVSHISWPKASKKDLLTTIQITLNEYRTFSKQCHTFPLGDDSIPTVIRLFAKRVHDNLHHPRDFAINWMKDVSRRISGWDDWSGNLPSMAFRIGSKSFHQMGRVWADEYSNCPERWDKFLEYLKESAA